MQISGGKLVNNEKNKNNTSKILLISMVLLVVLIICIIFTILYIQPKETGVYVNGQKISLQEDVIITDENEQKVYVSIKDIAGILGYTAHNGEYKLFSEDTNKCYVESDQETASFFLNSNKILKMPPVQTEDYEEYIIDTPVISKNGKLYTTPEGIKIGFNVTFDINKNSIQICTLPYLVQYYTTEMKKYGYEELSQEFNNQKAILYNLFVVKGTNGLYGVVTNTNTDVISSKYKEMKFNESAQEFFVTSMAGKVGIVTSKSETKINLIYDEIKMLDKTNGLYLVKSDSKYGVLNSSGNTVIHLEYSEIGIDTSKFSNNSIENKYLLFENLIPVSKNGKWGFFNIKGQEVLPTEYDSIGYSQGNIEGKIVDNLLIVPSCKAIIMGKKSGDKLQYGIYDYNGNEIVPCVLANAYSITNNGVSTYYMEHNGQIINIEEYIEQYNAWKSSQNNNVNQ